jgi:hypothetical protein
VPGREKEIGEIKMGKALSIARQQLQAYADRGVFRSFAEQVTKDGKVEFQFLFFGQKALTVVFSEKEHAMVLKGMLPDVSADLYAHLKGFLKDLFDPGLPEHRRIDKNLADVKFVKRGGSLSLVFQVKKNQYQYGVNKLINLASWIHTDLQSWYPNYLAEVMGEPQE